VIGLDFGTTNSCAAFGNYREEVATVSLTPVNTLPYDAILASSVLDPLGDGPEIGMRAQEIYRQLPASDREDRTYLNGFKLHLDDYRLKERRQVLEREEMVYHPHQQIDLPVQHYRQDWTPGSYTRDELVGAVTALVGQILRNANEQGADPARLFVGIPVAFSSRARKRLICALYRTGLFATYRDLLQRVRFVLEPLAAAAAGMREAFDADDRERVLIFDHGGGTLDLSLIEFERRPEFDYPVPVRELAAAGAKDVAGGSIDAAFAAELSEDSDIRKALARLDRWESTQYVKGAKEDLSTADEADLVVPGESFRVSRAILERAAAPILGRIDQETHRVLARGGLSISDVDRVLLTGGSSLVPCVQQRIRAAFPELNERGRVRAYDPRDQGDVERAITEVAQGLVHFGSDEAMERVVLWDLDLLSSKGREFIPVARRGDRYGFDEDGRPLLRRTVELADQNGDGMAIGLWEAQLDRQFFVFGLADVPPQPAPVRLEIRLRPDALYPALHLYDAAGNAITRDWRLTGWESDGQVAADMDLLEEGQLEEFFELDHLDFLPDTGFERFEHAPLTRPLRIGDRVEWTTYAAVYAGKPLVRGCGVIRAIRRIGEHEPIEEMDSLDLEAFEFTVRGDKAGTMFHVNQPHGYVRVGTHPERAVR
jgi:hypothetical protein